MTENNIAIEGLTIPSGVLISFRIKEVYFMPRLGPPYSSGIGADVKPKVLIQLKISVDSSSPRQSEQ
ncbi:MAG: hypothetical protein QXG05_01535 [Nitrososphaerota archaeon]